MTTVELLVFCQTRTPQPCVPDLLWQRQMHRHENLEVLCNDYGDSTPNGFHDTYIAILETRSWLHTIGRTYSTVLFTENAECSKPQK